MACFSTKKGLMLGRIVAGGMPMLFTACVSYTTPLGATNESVADVKQGQDCRVLLFGHGGHVYTVGEAMKQGSITTLRSVEYRETTFLGVGHECVIAHGE
jgi:hypothetical protein